MYGALEQLLNEFKQVCICPECLDLNVEPVDNPGICLNCSIRIALNYHSVECAICQENTCNYITLPCYHRFHLVCFAKVAEDYSLKHNCWYQKCPLCRAMLAYTIQESNVVFKIIR